MAKIHAVIKRTRSLYWANIMIDHQYVATMRLDDAYRTTGGFIVLKGDYTTIIVDSAALR